MSISSGSTTLPMKTAGTEHLIERTYRESGTFQWARETLINGQEAGATRIEFGIEWQAVENLGVYRRLIADNGSGMTAEQLEEFFNTFGGGGKPIGGAHENFGVGSKTSLLPWNTHGMVVVSWVDGDASMIWVHKDPDTGEYGLRLLETEDPDTGAESLEGVYEPYDDEEHGCDWSSIRPAWMQNEGSGTVIVLLGNSPNDDTVLGDPNRSESDIKGLSTYLNRRMWRFDPEVVVHVDELRTNDRKKWPRSEAMAHGVAEGGDDRRTNVRRIEGARHYVTYPDHSKGKLGADGTVMLADGTEVDWYLWEGERPAIQSYAAKGGYIAALYRNELYDVATHHSTYRTFGVSEAQVRQRLWLVVRPLELSDDARHGVYPRTDRNALLLKGGPSAGGGLPMADWAGEFADNMPDEIRAAISEARGSDAGSITDESWRQRLADRFGSRWRITKLRPSRGGADSVEPDGEGGAPGRTPKARKKAKKKGGGGKGGTGGTGGTGSGAGPRPASKSKVGGGIPWYRLAAGDEFNAGMLAAWQPNDPEHPEGVVLINRDHAVLLEEIRHWQGMYADHHAEAIADDVIAVYGEMAVAKVAHSEQLKSLVPAKLVDEDLRSEAALTMALLGLIGEEAILATRIGGKYGKRSAA